MRSFKETAKGKKVKEKTPKDTSNDTTADDIDSRNNGNGSQQDDSVKNARDALKNRLTKSKTQTSKVMKEEITPKESLKE